MSDRYNFIANYRAIAAALLLAVASMFSGQNANAADTTAMADSTVVIPAGSSTDLTIMLALIAFLILALFLMRSAMRRGTPPN